MSGYYSATHVQDKAMLKQDEAMLEQDKGKLKQDEAMHVRRTCKTIQRMCMIYQYQSYQLEWYLFLWCANDYIVNKSPPRACGMPKMALKTYIVHCV